MVTFFTLFNGINYIFLNAPVRNLLGRAIKMVCSCCIFVDPQLPLDRQSNTDNAMRTSSKSFRIFMISAVSLYFSSIRCMKKNMVKSVVACWESIIGIPWCGFKKCQLDMLSLSCNFHRAFNIHLWRKEPYIDFFAVSPWLKVWKNAIYRKAGISWNFPNRLEGLRPSRSTRPRLFACRLFSMVPSMSAGSSRYVAPCFSAFLQGPFQVLDLKRHYNVLSK